ncbi:protein FAR1-RELATED SEQUENCE 5 [Sesamum alatum]|uniref:Protein FAR1-RELATED SEQUENCE n=1 Tax=Sesamum alatum TaxID=300844 RepID=A0AAE1YZ60_9LAMI|nr:protein FAR1-RELATED SEQUENCE 5 [Sesamum alatum]
MEMKIGDTGGVLEYLQQKQFVDPNFFYAIQVDEDDLIANMVWVDAQMMVDYSHFGDVVSFDTTYRKNKEGRPFALFVGVNHHKQTIIFSAALLYDETESTFIWLFDTFARATSRKQPKTILTDQDAAMTKALTMTWPNTCHRLCIWHIYQNAAMHLSSVFARFTSFSKDFNAWIYDFEEEEEFLCAWDEMLNKYELKSNEWLERMFKLREKWALVYGRQSFCADMTTTQRSEKLCGEIGEISDYKITPFRKHYHHTVMYDSIQGNVSCSCKKFEFAGILCSHALKVLSLRNIVKIPELYIKKRWTKKAKKGVVEAQPLRDSVSAPKCVNENKEKKIIGVHYKELCSLYSQLVTRAALTDETFKLAKTSILKMIEEVEVKLENMTVVSPNDGPKSVVKKALVSRVDEKRSVDALLSVENACDDVSNASGEVSIKGWKNKEKRPIKSGKRPKNGLEKSIRRKRQQQNIVSSSNNSIPCASIENNEQVAEMGGYNQYITPTEGSSLSHMEPFQFTRQQVIKAQGCGKPLFDKSTPQGQQD